MAGPNSTDLTPQSVRAQTRGAAAAEALVKRAVLDAPVLTRTAKRALESPAIVPSLPAAGRKRKNTTEEEGSEVVRTALQ